MHKSIVKSLLLTTMLLLNETLNNAWARHKIDLPIDIGVGKGKCMIGRNDKGTVCLIQHLPDVNVDLALINKKAKRSAPKKQDFTCGSSTYSSHTGTDFRVLQYNNQTVNIVAPQAGRVIAIQNSVKDSHLIDRGALNSSQYCGNSVTILHKNKWRTRLCHLKKGSVTVRKNQEIQKGKKVGEMGQSGMSQFKHVHITVINPDGCIIDPYTGTVIAGTNIKSRRPCVSPTKRPKCSPTLRMNNKGGKEAGTLWSPKAQSQMGWNDPYGLRITNLLSSGVFGSNKSFSDVMQASAIKEHWGTLNGNSEVLKPFIAVSNVKKGDYEYMYFANPYRKSHIPAIHGWQKAGSWAVRKITKDESWHVFSFDIPRRNKQLWKSGKHTFAYSLIRPIYDHTTKKYTWKTLIYKVKNLKIK